MDPKKKRVVDRELSAIRRILSILEELDKAQAHRVVGYINERLRWGGLPTIVEDEVSEPMAAAV